MKKNTKQEGGAFEDVAPLCVRRCSFSPEEQKGKIRDGAQSSNINTPAAWWHNLGLSMIHRSVRSFSACRVYIINKIIALSP